MDYQKALDDLAAYRVMVERSAKTPALSHERESALRELNRRTPLINGIVASLSPDHAQITGTSIDSHTIILGAIDRATGQALNSVLMDKGRDCLGLPIHALGDLVSDAAREHVLAGRFRNAVSDAATSVNSYTQQRLGRYDVSDKALMAEAFSEKPPAPGAPRLRCPGNQQSLHVQSQQEGAKLFAMGCYAAIRNPAHHLTGDWTPQLASLQLAAFGLVARWVTEWDVIYDPVHYAEILRNGTVPLPVR